MPTTITRTVGTTGFYSTPQAANDAAPADLGAADQIWRMELQNQVFTGTNTVLNISGSVSTSSCYKIFTTVAGASFRDHASKLTNALVLDSSKGATITQTGSYSNPTVIVGEEYARIVGIQIGAASGGGGPANPATLQTAPNCLIEGCIVEGHSATGPLRSGGGRVISTLVVQRFSGANSIVNCINTGAITFENCTFVVPSGTTRASALISRNYNQITIRNSDCFGANTILGGASGPAPVYSSCYTDATSPPSGWTAAAYDTTTGAGFQNTSSDFRRKSSSALTNAGAVYGGQPTVDVIGQTFASPPTVGAWEAAPGGGGDTTAPTLTSPTGASTGSTTGSGTVSTNEANGTLYRLASTNATESAATVKAAALSQAVSATGTQSVTFTGLTASTTYYAHYVHTDLAGNDSARVSSASFTTAAAGDTTAPTLTSPTGTTTGATTATGTVSTNEANGTLYYVTTVNATETAATVKAGSSQTVTATGVQSVSRVGLAASTTYRHHFLHRDAAGNDSTVSSSAPFTTSAATGGTLTVTNPLCNNTGLLSGRWISQTGITLTVISEATKAGVLVVTGRATDSNGVLTAPITDAAISTGQSYSVVAHLGSSKGITQVLSAT